MTVVTGHEQENTVQTKETATFEGIKAEKKKTFRGLGRNCPPGHNLKGFSSLKVESVYAIYNHSAIECFKVADVEFLL